MFSGAIENRRARMLESKCRATLAQLVERLIRNEQVAGSIPAGGSSVSFPRFSSPFLRSCHFFGWRRSAEWVRFVIGAPGRHSSFRMLLIFCKLLFRPNLSMGSWSFTTDHFPQVYAAQVAI